MIERPTPPLAVCAACLLGSVSVTALIVGSQLGIADSYTRQADAVLAGKAGNRVAGTAIDAPASPGAALAGDRTRHGTREVCLYDAQVDLRGVRDGRPEQHQRADTPCQRG